MRTAYLGTSEFAATVLRRLAESPHKPSLVVTPPDSRRGRGRRELPPPAAEVAAELALPLLQSADVNEEAARVTIAAAAPAAVVVCAFGQLIREPLLSDYPLLNVHPSLLPRWRGAAPIERAIMAGDAETGTCIMQLTAGLDSGPVALTERIEIGPEEDFAALSARLAALSGDLLVRALDRYETGMLDFAEQDESAVTYAEKIDPAERRIDLARSATAEAARVRALTPHVGAYLELAGGERLGVKKAHAAAAADGPLAVPCGEGFLVLDLVQPAGGKPMEAAAYLRGHEPPGPGVIAPARLLAFATIRETFEDGAHTERAFRVAADRLELDGRERAQAQRLAYGAVQRRGTTDAAIGRLSDRAPNLLDPPVLSALRLGLYELLFADGTPDHAAVDQAVELVKSAKVAHAAGLVNAVLRRATREREKLLADLLGDDSTPEKAAVAHSAPLWLVQLWWEELGPAVARTVLAACNEPAEVALRAREPEAALAKLREAGVEAAPAAGGWPLEVAEMIVVSGRTGPLVAELVAAGELTPQSRGSAATVAVLDAGPEDHVLDLCAGPGIKTGQIAERRGDRGQLISVELNAERAEEIAAQATRLHLHSATIFEADATSMQLPEEFDLALVDAPCSDLGALASRPDARWRKSPQTIARVTAIQDGILRAAARALRPGGALVYSTCTISRAENEDRVAALLAAAGSDGVPALEIEDLGARAPGLASVHDPRCLQLRPDRDRTTGFFIARVRRND